MYYDDYSYIIYIIVPLLFSLWAQWKINSSFKKYSKQKTSKGVTGAQAATEVLQRGNVTDVKVGHTKGNLTDFYDPRKKEIKLSDPVYEVDSIAAVGVAAHEAGHALQYAANYFPIKIRTFILPITQFGSQAAIPLIVVGMALGFTGLIDVGIILFAVVVAFQLITLPVEFNASARALTSLEKANILTTAELGGAKKVLSSAALTYVAALAASLGQLLNLIAMSGRKRD